MKRGERRERKERERREKGGRRRSAESDDTPVWERFHKKKTFSKGKNVEKEPVVLAKRRSVDKFAKQNLSV